MSKLPTTEEIKEFHTLSEEFHTYAPLSGEIHSFWGMSTRKLNRYNSLASKIARLAEIPRKKRGRPHKKEVPHQSKQKRRQTQIAKLMMSEENRKKALRQLRKKKKGASNETDVE